MLTGWEPLLWPIVHDGKHSFKSIVTLQAALIRF